MVPTAVNGLDVTMGEQPGLTGGDVLPSVSTAVEFFNGQGGYQELDLDVANSTELLGNYLADIAGVAGAIPAGEALGTTTLPDSLAYAAKPAFFGVLTWPPIDPTSPTFDFEAIPAGYRYINDAAPPEEPIGGVLRSPDGLRTGSATGFLP